MRIVAVVRYCPKFKNQEKTEDTCKKLNCMGAHMDIIKFIRCNREVSELLEEICDVSILPILKEPQNQNGQLKYNIAGMTFAKRKVR